MACGSQIMLSKSAGQAFTHVLPACMISRQSSGARTTFPVEPYATVWRLRNSESRKPGSFVHGSSAGPPKHTFERISKWSDQGSWSSATRSSETWASSRSTAQRRNSAVHKPPVRTGSHYKSLLSSFDKRMGLWNELFLQTFLGHGVWCDFCQ